MKLGIALALACLATRIGAAEPESVFPFVLPWDDAAPGITDLSGWLTKPAGKAGHVRVSAAGHFHAGTERIRFLGVNMSFAGGMPKREDAPKIAGRLAKFGVNVVRFHHMDTSRFPDGIRSRDSKSTGDIDPEALDRLHFFIAELKQRGIYANINLLVGRPFNAADGLPAEIESMDWKDRHLVGFFNPKQLELQKDYARKVLSPVNPYTKLAPAADPAVAFVEINNEQGLVHGWLGGDVDRMPDVFRSELKVQWNAWLAQRYGRTEKLRAAWSEGAQPLGAELLANGDFSQQFKNWNIERHGGAKAETSIISGTGANALRAARLVIETPGAESWHVQLTQSGFALEKGRAYTLQFAARGKPARLIGLAVNQAHEPWANLGLSPSAQLADDWREFRFVFNATDSDSNARVSFTGLGAAGAEFEVRAVSLRPGGVDGLAPSERIEDRTVAAFEKQSFGNRTPAAQRDWMRFLTETEDRYWQAMYRFIKENLGVKALVTGTIAGCSPMNVQAKMDWVDTHSYWQHPRFPGRAWDSGNWIVENKTMVNERGGTLPGLALRRVIGKPHACTEYNHPAPNTFSSEGFLLLAAYAALQDWDAIYVYSYAHSRKDGWDSRKINSFFDVDQHPTKMATLLAAAAMFVRGDVQAANEIVAAELPLQTETDLLRRARNWDLVNGGHAGIPRETALVHRVGVATEGVAKPANVLDVAKVTGASDRFASDTSELKWDLSNTRRGVVTVNTTSSKAVIGFGGGKTFDLGGIIVEPGEGLQNGWSAITLTRAEKGKTSTPHWLITATGYAENTGMGWKNAEKSTVGRDWGTAPSRVEGVPARVTFPVPASRVEAWAIDARGQRTQKLPIQSDKNARATVEIGSRWKTLWYEIAINQ